MENGILCHHLLIIPLFVSGLTKVYFVIKTFYYIPLKTIF